jgi:hypothetical protein
MKQTTAFAPFSGNDIASWAAAMGLELDAVQQAILDAGIRRGIVNCCRQFGKSTTVALKAANFAANRPNSTAILVARSARQSEELLNTVAGIVRQFVTGATYSSTRIELANGSRILALPSQPQTIRGYAADLVVIDEAAYVDDAIWDAVFPMLNAAEGGGHLWMMSTPFRPAGFFYRFWMEKNDDWVRFQVKAPDCPRISAAMIAEAKRTFTGAEFAREYLCEFAQAATAPYPQELLRSCVVTHLPDFLTTAAKYPLLAAPYRARPHDFMGVDFGKEQDPSAIVIVEFVMEPRGTVDAATRAPLFDCGLVVRHIESPPLGTDFLDVGARALQLARHPRLQGHCTIVADANGPGNPVEYMERPPLTAPLIAVKTTSGQAMRKEGKYYHVSKSVLMDRLEYALRMKKVRIQQLPLTEPLLRELTLLEREERSSGNAVFHTPSARVHDDLAMALAMAVWWAWEVHGHYLKMEGPIPLVSDAGMMHVTHQHPLLRGVDLRLGGPGWRR